MTRVAPCLSGDQGLLLQHPFWSLSTSQAFTTNAYPHSSLLTPKSRPWEQQAHPGLLPPASPFSMPYSKGTHPYPYSPFLFPLGIHLSALEHPRNLPALLLHLLISTPAILFLAFSLFMSLVCLFPLRVTSFSAPLQPQISFSLSSTIDVHGSILPEERRHQSWASSLGGVFMGLGGHLAKERGCGKWEAWPPAFPEAQWALCGLSVHLVESAGSWQGLK